MAPLELDSNSALINELLKTIRQLQITSAATSEALAATNVTLAALRASSRNQNRGVDKRLPFEIWEHVLTFLYPSQIVRLSRASRTLHSLIGASIVWSRWFRIAFGPDVLLDTLPATPESTSYMLYMCAVSGRVCEQCLIYSVPSRLVNDRAARPLPVLIPNSVLRRRGRKQGSAINSKPDVTTTSNEPTSNGNGPTHGRNSNSLLQGIDNDRKQSVTVVGEPINKTWSIRLCLPCRQIHYLDHPEAIPVHVLGKYRSFQLIQETYNLTVHEVYTLPSRVQLESFGYQSTVYSEEAAFRLSRHKHGGEVGMAVFNQPSLMVGQEQRTEDRIDAYRQL